ncbi:MAG: hypothetical protein WBD24_06395 [Candidatus Omnitrophota bacterium]
MRLLKIVSLVILGSFLFSCSGKISFAGEGQEEAEEFKLYNDPRLAEAREAFEKAQEFMEKGHEELRRRPGMAKKYYEHAESYFETAAFHYRESGDKYNIDTGHEVMVCEKMSREAHVWISKARGKTKGSAVAY